MAKSLYQAVIYNAQLNGDEFRVSNPLPLKDACELLDAHISNKASVCLNCITFKKTSRPSEEDLAKFITASREVFPVETILIGWIQKVRA